MPFRDKLLDLGLGAGFLQLGNQLLGIFLGDGFLQGLGAVVHQILGILQAQAGSGTDNLDDTRRRFFGISFLFPVYTIRIPLC